MTRKTLTLFAFALAALVAVPAGAGLESGLDFATLEAPAWQLAGVVNEIAVFPGADPPATARVRVSVGLFGAERNVTCPSERLAFLIRCSQLEPGEVVVFAGRFGKRGQRIAERFIE